MILLTGAASASPLPDIGIPLAGLDWLTLGLQAALWASPVIAGLLAWLARAAAILITGRIEAGWAQDLLMRLNTQAYLIVTELQQTTIEALRKTNEDGVITAEEAAEIRQVALDRLKSYIGPRGLAEILKVLGLGGQGLDGFLGTLIESAVFRAKAKI